MATQELNRVHIFVNDEHKPYRYAAIQIVKGEHQWFEKPFIISKRRPNQEEVVYGTVKNTLHKIMDQIQKLDSFRTVVEHALDTVEAPYSMRNEAILPHSELTNRILDEQEKLLEDVLLSISLNVRILSELFPENLKKVKTKIYDYEGEHRDSIELAEIANLLLHNRYLLIKAPYVIDLISDRKFMTSEAELGLKVHFFEYISQVSDVVEKLTVENLIVKLLRSTESLSASSNIKDIVFLVQNLYTLGGMIVGSDTCAESGPLKTILDRITTEYVEAICPNGTVVNKKRAIVNTTYTAPRFTLEPDLSEKQIRIAMTVNGNPESLVMGYKEFFSEVVWAYGNRKLYSGGVFDIADAGVVLP